MVHRRWEGIFIEPKLLKECLPPNVDRSGEAKILSDELDKMIWDEISLAFRPRQQGETAMLSERYGTSPAQKAKEKGLTYEKLVKIAENFEKSEQTLSTQPPIGFWM